MVVSSVLSPRPTRLPGFHLRRADESVDGRGDARVAEVERRLFDRAPWRLRRCAHGGVLLGHARRRAPRWLTACLATSGVYRFTSLSAFFRRASAVGLVGLGRREDRFERLAIDRVEQIALLNE